VRYEATFDESGVIYNATILFVNFEDERLSALKGEALGLVLDAYYELFPELVDSQIHVLLDEVQAVEGWERFVARIFEDKRYSVVITGSSSKLLSKEIATSLRGRSIATYLHPLSFAEFAAYRGLTKRGPRIGAAFQVSVDPDSAGERETKGLLAALETFSLESGTIVTADTDREDTIGGKRVRYIPLWRWLLESPDAGQGVGIPETRRGAS
jgi:predicted AAA+ superfamily ATPase